MTLSVFDDRSRQPTKTDLSNVLGTTFVLWNDLEARIAARFPSTSPAAERFEIREHRDIQSMETRAVLKMAR